MSRNETRRRSRRHASAPRLSLTLIARNEEDFLGDCLDSVRDLADEMVVVDTGSDDRTRDVAREHGARVFEFPWNESFAEARNAALSHATGDAVLQLDADERLQPETHDAVRSALRQADRDYWYLNLTNLSAEGPVGDVVRTLRLFRHTPGLCYVGRIHEQPVLDRPGRGGLCNAMIFHLGYQSQVFAKKGKSQRNQLLIRRGLEDTAEGGDARLRSLYLFYHALQGEGDERMARLTDLAEFVRAREGELRSRMPWIPCGMIHYAAERRNRGDDRAAADAVRWTSKRYGESPVLNALAAHACLREGDFEGAERLLRRSREQRLDPGSIHLEYHLVPGIAIAVADVVEAELRERQGRFEVAEEIYRRVDLRRTKIAGRLAAVQIAQGKLEQALAALNEHGTPVEHAPPAEASAGLILSLLAQSSDGLLRWGERVREVAPSNAMCRRVLDRVESWTPDRAFCQADFPELQQILRLPATIESPAPKR